MKEFRTKFLDEDWQVDLRATILSMHQSPDQSFDDYATDVVALASLLVDEPIDDQHLRHQLEAGMSDDLRYMYMRSDKIKELNKKTPAPDVDTWVRAVNKVDEERRRNLDIHRRLLLENKENMKRNRSHTNDNDDRAPKKHHGDKSSTPKPPSGANSFSSSSKNPYPPRLSDTERDLLRNNAGCTRCRKPFAGHQGADCPAPATADNYQVVTEKLVADARRAIAKSSTAGSSKTIAAIVPPVVPDEDESDDDESDESSSDLGNRTDVSHPQSSSPRSPSHASRHFLWPCLIEGPMSNLPLHVHGLIDNGSFLVMIHEDLADKLALRRFKLREPQEIDVAFSSSTVPTPALTHYVKL
ncbi:hypothetical protein DFH06DRAFT_1064985, partial [Mycena polygramma]